MGYEDVVYVASLDFRMTNLGGDGKGNNPEPMWVVGGPRDELFMAYEAGLLAVGTRGGKVPKLFLVEGIVKDAKGQHYAKIIDPVFPEAAPAVSDVEAAEFAEFKAWKAQQAAAPTAPKATTSRGKANGAAKATRATKASKATVQTVATNPGAAAALVDVTDEELKAHA